MINSWNFFAISARRWNLHLKMTKIMRQWGNPFCLWQSALSWAGLRGPFEELGIFGSSSRMSDKYLDIWCMLEWDFHDHILINSQNFVAIIGKYRCRHSDTSHTFYRNSPLFSLIVKSLFYLIIGWKIVAQF